MLWRSGANDVIGDAFFRAEAFCPARGASLRGKYDLVGGNKSLPSPYIIG